MIFNSVEFWLFFFVVVSVYFSVPGSLRRPLLLLASYVFYMAWNASYALLLLASTANDYLVGLLLLRHAEPTRRKWIILLSIAANLSLLFVFKYWDFFHQSAKFVLRQLGIPYEPSQLHVLLPVGISFYTFQSLSYTIDVYRRRIPTERSLPLFALFVSFFPQLVAGPIERASHLIPRLKQDVTFDGRRTLRGLELCLWGLFKKVVIADRLSVYVDGVYPHPELHNGTTLLIATYAFAFQIYCDFSGYSDIAIGTARILGFDLMENFRTPYFSTSVRDFWRRWHISLSSWLRDYLYIPLGGSRHGPLRTYMALFVTMLLGGLWHGASWNFVIWGALHGGMLAVSRATLHHRDRVLSALRVPTWLSANLRRLVCFHLVCFTWIFFRASTWRVAMSIVHGILRGPWGHPFIHPMTFAHAAIGLCVLLTGDLLLTQPLLFEKLARNPVLRWSWAYTALAAIALLGVEEGAQFIYFQF